MDNAGANYALIKSRLDARDPTKNKWDSIKSAYFAYSSATRVTVTIPSFAANEVFQVGDKLKITQASTAKYFSIIGTSATYIDITGGTDYTFTNDTIEYFEFSKSSNPVGHPLIFNYSSTLAAYGQSHTVSSQGTFTGKFIVEGRLVTAFIQRVDFQLAGVADYYVRETLPITRNTNMGIYITTLGINAVDLYYAIAVKSPPSAGSASATNNIEIFRLPYAVYRLASNTSHFLTVNYVI